MDDFITERSFDPEATCVIYVFGSFLDILAWLFLYNQALADVRSTGAEIRWLYCRC